MRGHRKISLGGRRDPAVFLRIHAYMSSEYICRRMPAFNSSILRDTFREPRTVADKRVYIYIVPAQNTMIHDAYIHGNTVT